MKTNKMSKVLIALDYNQSAQKVAELGFALAHTMGAEITLLHVISDPIYYSSVENSPITGFPGYMEVGPIQFDSIEGLKKASFHFLDKLKQHLGDHSIQTMVKEGDTAETILIAAKELHADLIVLGSHSMKWLEEIIMGSITEEVLQHSKIPLFIVPIKKHE